MTTKKRTVNEKSPLCITMTFTDENGDPLIPSTVDWRLDDMETGTTIVDWTALSSPAATMYHTIEAQYNLINDEANNIREAQMFTVRINETLQSEAHAEYKYHVVNLTSVSSA